MQSICESDYIFLNLNSSTLLFILIYISVYSSEIWLHKVQYICRLQAVAVRKKFIVIWLMDFLTSKIIVMIKNTYILMDIPPNVIFMELNENRIVLFFMPICHLIICGLQDSLIKTIQNIDCCYEKKRSWNICLSGRKIHLLKLVSNGMS